MRASERPLVGKLRKGGGERGKRTSLRSRLQIEYIATIQGTALLDELWRDALRHICEHAAGRHLRAEVKEGLMRFEQEIGVDDSVAEGEGIGGARGNFGRGRAENHVVVGAVGGGEDGRLRRDLVELVEHGRTLREGVVAVKSEGIIGADLDLGIAVDVTDVTAEVVRIGSEQGGRLRWLVEVDLVVDVRVGIGQDFELGDDT